MAPGFDRAALDRLIELGRQRGRLTPEDLRADLPIAALSAEDLALIVLEIEEAGVPVELEEMLAALTRPADLREPGTLSVRPAAPQPAPILRPTVQDGPELPRIEAAREGTAPAASPRRPASATWAVIAGGALTFCALAVYLLARGG